MKNVILGLIAALAVLALVVSFNSYFLIRSQACQNALNRCVQQCDSTRDRALGENDQRRTTIEINRGRAWMECVIQYHGAGNNQALQECRTEADNVANAELETLAALDEIIRERREQCVTECNTQAKKCDNPFAGGIDAAPRIDVTAPIDCLAGGGPCFKPVLEICTQIAGPCDECWTTLCGGGDYSFESSVPLEVTLVAATDPAKNARVLASSSMKEKQAVLSVPSHIKLNRTERLYFGFSSKEKPGGPVKALIRRSR